MLLGVTLITQITQSQPRLWNGGEDDKKAERMIAGNLDRGGHLSGNLWMGGNYAGIPAACFADDRGGGSDEHDDDSIMVKVY